MTAREVFDGNIERARVLLGLHTQAYPTGRPPDSSESADVLRATVVFAVAALDSYLHDKIRDKALRVLRHYCEQRTNPPAKLLEILKPQLGLEKALQLVYRKRPDEELRKILDRELFLRTYQDPGQIEKGLHLLGVADFWESMRKKLRLARVKQAREFVQPYVTRRHQIVHQGDVYKSKRHRGKLRRISRPFARDCVSRIRRFVLALDRTIDETLRKRGVP